MKKIIKIKEASELTGLTASYLRNLASKGDIPCSKQGKFLVFDPEDLRLWNLERMVFSTYIEAKQAVSNYWIDDEGHFFETEEDLLRSYGAVGYVYEENAKWKIWLIERRWSHK